ncbi:MAG: ABC transporter permease [Planctomycetaceae bacterium]|nr:ABC transporter permease [Planctomycetaceae bacterium]
MLAGPLFTREALTTPRQFKHYLFRAGYLGAFFVLMYTAAQTTFGFQTVRNLGDIARFGGQVFQILSFVQLTLILFFSVLFAAGNVAIEKDRRTLILLLMTDLPNRELVLGKLLGSLLLPGVLITISLPAFLMVALMGGVGFDQLWASLGTCAAVGLAAGCWGTLVAFWREKTFQTLAISLLGLVFWLGLVEVVGWMTAETAFGSWAAALNPFRVLWGILSPFDSGTASPVICGLEYTALSLILVLVTISRLRVWNPSRGVYEATSTIETGEKTTVRTREPRTVWELPILWREMRTRAYGRRAILIKGAYLLFAAVAIGSQVVVEPSTDLILGMLPPAGFLFAGLSLLCFLMVNTQAVTALTSERDANTLELLLVTEVTASEFTWGKLLGVLYNSKELIAVPLLWLGWLVASGFCPVDHAIFVLIGFLTLTFFSAMLGLHAGLTYHNSRQAIGSSLGTIFFLFIGIFVCMILILQARASFALQLPSFLVFILGGAIALIGALAQRNQAPALYLASSILPFATFYAITTFLLGQMFEVCVAVTAAYGFTIIAMLIPAVSEFDVALSEGSANRG